MHRHKLDLRSIRRAMASAALGLLVAPQAAHSAPGEVTGWMMNDPATVFDVGMLRLEVWLDEVGEGLNTGFDFNYMTSVHYDYEDDEIVMTANVYMDPYFRDLGEYGCVNFMQRVRSLAFVNPSTGGYARGNTSSNIAPFFGHSGLERLNAPKGWRQELDKRLRLRCLLLSEQEDLKLKAHLLMTGDLLSLENSVTDYEE